MAADEVEYEPIGVKPVLVEMKDTAELLIDLAFSSVLYGSRELAEEVLELEAEVDGLEAWTLRAAASVEDPIALRGVFRIAAATEVISDAALEIAEGVLRGLPTHPVVSEAFEAAAEVIVRLTVGTGSPLEDDTLGEPSSTR